MADPIELPELIGFTTKTFDIGHVQQITPTGEVGFLQTLDRSAPAWYAEYETKPLSGEAYDQVRVFVDMLEGSRNTFLAWDPRRPMPRAYSTLSTLAQPWGVSPRITAQDYTASTIDLDQMTVAASIKGGDYISVQIDSVWYLFRSMENRTVLNDGTVPDLLVKPRPDIASFAATQIRYQKACMEMKIIGKVEERDSFDSFPTFHFRAGQFTRRAPI